ADDVTTESICSGNTYTWPANGITYSTSQTALKIVNDGCTADQILNLTVTDKPADAVTNKTICFGETYTWPANGITYSISQNALKIVNDGCTADQILNLTVTDKPADAVTNETICFGETYTWPANGITYSASQTGLRITNDGCTADQILNLTVNPKPADAVTNQTICFGETYTWPANGITYSTSQTGLKIVNDGCTADQILNLTVIDKPLDAVTNETICSGQTYTWPANGITYSTSQTGLRKVNDGCMADEVLNLNISLPLTSELIPNTLFSETCNGERNGAFSIQITGGTIPYKVALNNIDGVYQSVTGSDYTFKNLKGGQYIVFIKDALNCKTEQTITVENGISLNPVINTNYYCENNSPSNSVTVSIDESNSNLNEIDYSLDGGAFQSDNIFKNLSHGLHTIAARHLNGCLESTAPFVIDFIEPLKLSLTNTELNEIKASGENGSGNYQYSFEEEPFSKNNNFIIYKSGTYTITVKDESGCTFSKSQYFDYIDLCIPNYFTPNGDGISDYWGPNCASNYKNLTYTIFDRYGRELANYHFGQKWDGKYRGQELTSGDYWYVLKLNDPKDNREFVGHFTLYR
ncbi:T9SS type B sorting domain-containing protein, partial [Flavobacterium zhairuonense]|uniref:T9SS type B sorting domain-containing protein n=1 Tax=Flavobacterium zhairuonense TaxID=2493631 RepID=UPI00104D8B97